MNLTKLCLNCLKEYKEGYDFQYCSYKCYIEESKKYHNYITGNGYRK